MLEPFYKNKFKQDVARMKKRGKQLRKLQEVISMLIEQHALPLKYRDHILEAIVCAKLCLCHC